MATAAEPADGSQGPKPEKGRPEAARSEKARLGAEAVGEKTSGPEAARGHRRRKPKSRAAESQSARVQAQSTEEPKLEGREPERTRPRRHFATAERAVSRPRGSPARPWHVPVPPHPGLTPDPAGLTCVAHGGGVHCAWKPRQMRRTSDAEIAVTIPRALSTHNGAPPPDRIGSRPAPTSHLLGHDTVYFRASSYQWLRLLPIS